MSHALANIWSRLRYGPDVVVVSGLPRSGTSMMMRMLAAGGVPLLSDGEREADRDNPHGYFELERVKRLERDPDRSWVRDARGHALKVVSPLLRWLPAGNAYRIVFMLRDLDEVIRSQNRMLERLGEPNPVDDGRTRELYARHLDDVRRLMRRRPGVRWLDVRYDEAVLAPERVAAQVHAFLGLAGDVAPMARAIDGELYRNRKETP